MALPRPPAIHALPTELVREIIRAGCDDSCAEITLPLPIPKPLAVSVSQFCARWRTVAHREPALWQNFCVDLPDELHGGKYEALMNFIANGASKNRTSLILRQGSYRPLNLNPLLPVLLTYAQCMRSLSLNIPGQTVSQLFGSSALPFHHLETLSVAVRVEDENGFSFLETEEYQDEFPLPETPKHHIARIFARTPLLTRVTIGYDKIMPISWPPFPLDSWNLPRSQLTEFNGSNIWIDANQFFNIIGSCPNLVICVLTVDAEGADDPENDEARITLAHLRKFHITFLEHYSWVWSNLNMPSLVDLKIATYRDTTEWEDDVFEEFMLRSRCSLTHLTLCFGFLEIVDAVMRILDSAPDLQELTLRWTRLPQADDPEWDVASLMEYLSFHTPSTTSLPNMHRICIDAAPESVRMLVSRCHGTDCALRHVVLYAQQPSTCEALFRADIAMIRAAGATVLCEQIVFPLREIYDPLYNYNPSVGARTPSPSTHSEVDLAEVYPLTDTSEESSVGSSTA
ncbi:F-box domain-containing protein [Mycena sanguinolenta]|uniref:F-box domain-containing protein n=1 Tax=Mycena sanguinolenta TaxID=230812 RepID=A0A8H6XJW0_9AGAR|nr:F-box domain-containing protein [Mycena sanguinolenta]